MVKDPCLYFPEWPRKTLLFFGNISRTELEELVLASPSAKIALEFSRQKRRQISGNSSQVPEPDHQKPQTFWIKILRQNQRYRDPSRFSLQRSWFQTRFARTNNI